MAFYRTIYDTVEHIDEEIAFLKEKFNEDIKELELARAKLKESGDRQIEVIRS